MRQNMVAMMSSISHVIDLDVALTSQRSAYACLSLDPAHEQDWDWDQ